MVKLPWSIKRIYYIVWFKYWFPFWLKYICKGRGRNEKFHDVKL